MEPEAVVDLLVAFRRDQDRHRATVARDDDGFDGSNIKKESDPG
jgi:hypothetical protein